MALKCLKPRLSVLNTSRVAAAPKTADPFYSSTAWRARRREILVRDRWVCTTPGCEQRAVIVDHRIARRAGGDESDANLRSLCRSCDAKIREDSVGVRKSGGVVKVSPMGRPILHLPN